MSVSRVDADGIAKVIAGYVHRGLRVVRLNGLARPGECTCWKRGDCGSPGKHPTGPAWETTTDEEQVFEWWGGRTRFNVGVVLGDACRGSGPAVIDIEADSDEAAAELRRLGLDRFETPTWSSGRGLHRLFRWSPELPAVQVLKPHGIEVRIGGGGKQTQSVMPPSMHHSGRAYQWQPGFGLDEVEIAAVPDNMMEAIVEAARRGSAENAGNLAPGRRSTAILRGPVSEGGRNDAVFHAACLLSRSIHPGDDELEQALLDVLRAVNTTRCRPPLADDEVKGVFRSALKYRREDTAAEALFPGVEAIVEGSRTVYRPAGLELTIHQGDPTMFELRCDELRAFNPSGTVRVPADVWSDARKMKTALIAAFPGVPFDRHPGDFARIWDGTAPQAVTKNHPAREAVTGLRVLLEQDAIAAGRRVEVTDPAENATRRLVGYLVEKLDQWAQFEGNRCEDEDASEHKRILIQCGSTGGWVDGRFYFVLNTAWQQVASKYGIERGAQEKVSLAMPEIIGQKLGRKRVRWKNSGHVYRILSERELEMLRAYAAGEPVRANGASGYVWRGDDVSPGGEKGVAAVARGEETTK